MMDISERQQAYIDFLLKFEEANGYPPTFKDIALGMKVTSKGTVSSMVDMLAAMGLVEKAKGNYRGTRSVQKH